MSRPGLAGTRSHGRILGLALLLVAWPAAARAQGGAPFLDVQRFDPIGQGHGMVRVREAEQLQAWRWNVGLGFSYGLNPLQQRDDADPKEGEPVVPHLFGVDLYGAIGLGSRIQLGLSMPVLMIEPAVKDNLRAPAWGHGGSEVGIGDLKAAVGFQVLRQNEGGLALSVAPRVVIPTGSRRMLVGSGTVGLGLNAAVGARRRFMHVNLNLGFQVNPTSRENQGLMPDDELRWALGVGLPLGRDLWVEPYVEFVGATVIDPKLRTQLGKAPFDPQHTPMELDVGVRFDPVGPLHANVAFGPGVGPGFGSPELRIYATIGFQPETGPDRDRDGVAGRADRCPDEPEDRDGWEDGDGCPDPDNDEDGLADADDEAPDEPEDWDGYQAQDGAPDPDNDGDSVPDAQDGCPMEAEDFDGWQDDDGCPEADNDGDGVPDLDDAAPNQPEDHDGWMDDDGLPDIDNDGDEILDDADACPMDKEVVNGWKDADGCPDVPGEADAADLVRYDSEGGEIKILEKVYFDLGKATIKVRSYALLNAVAALVQEHQELTLIEVQGHTDNQGSVRTNMVLSQERAEAVVQHLVDRGIAASRLTAVGLGESQPLDLAQTEAAHAINRRVQFVILSRADGAERTDSGEDMDEKGPGGAE